MSSQRYISDTLKRKKEKTKKIKIYIFIFLVCLCLGTLLYLVRLPAIQISNIKVSGTMFVSRQEVESTTQNILKSNILWVIPKSNIFIFSKQELQEQLTQNPAIVSAKIRKKLFNTISIEIQEKEKEIIYCTSFERLECYYVNTAGLIYVKVQDFIIPEQEIIVYSDQAPKKIQDIILEQEVYTNLILFIKNSARYDIKIGEIYLRADGVIELKTREQTILKVSIFDDFKKDFTNLIALFEQGILTKEQLPIIEYIDIRFGNKVFYKNKTN